jgi:carboxylesterase type B
MIGVNADEGLLISMGFYKSDELMESFEKNWNNCILWTFGATREAPNADEIVAKTKELYFPKDSAFEKEQKLQQFTKLFSDSWFNLHSSHAISVQSQFSPVYPYYFSRRGGPSFTAMLEMIVSKGNMIVKMMRFGVSLLYNKITGSKPRYYGVCHYDEVALQFKINGLFNIPKNPSSTDYMFSKEMVKLWVDFAKDDKKLEFKGVPFLPQVPDKPLQYLKNLRDTEAN